ncbi:MAG: sugar ABC transporter ATP-binding protein [Tropicimonas sp.]|uniref:sugar ABC transporter ATP-binding protein n=1 Tax=Tropicimonas sp. TaxID=2067044 RepID=UPI003A8C2B51
MKRSEAAPPRLEMRGIRKTFGPVRALEDVSLVAYAGEVHALMGENGAGKSTLMKILSGAYVPDPGGEVLVDGRKLPFGKPKTARSFGIAVIYQELALAPNLTVAQNVFLGEETARGIIVDRAEMTRRTQTILDRLGVAFGPGDRVGSLSLGECQMVEIARALSADPRIIVMDEPTTALTTRETDRLFEVIAGLKRDGIAIIYISHRMDEVYTLADRCSVLRDGSCVGTLERAELDAGTLVSMMVGRDLSTFYRKDHSAVPAGREVVMAVEGMSDGRHVRDCSFVARRGEVLGIAGLVGSGRTELLRLIYGADPKVAGRVLLNGTDVTPGSPRAALEHGIVYLTEDRKGLGLFLDMSVLENVNIAVAEQDSGGLMRRNGAIARKRGDDAIAQLAIRTPSAAQKVGALSGGNQQKVLLGRLLQSRPAVLLLDEPTRGVDIGAKSEIYRLINELAQNGLAIVMVSSELPEIIGVADRCLVMRDGEIAGEIAASNDNPIEQEAIMAISTGAAGAVPSGAKPGAAPVVGEGRIQ